MTRVLTTSQRRHPILEGAQRRSSLLYLLIVGFTATFLTTIWTATEVHQLDDHLLEDDPLPSHNKVHVVQTRFMQTQPNLIHLGKARLELFLTFTLPSMLVQTNRNFLWIIRTDPNLDNSLLKPLIGSLTLPNFILVGSNENPEGFRNAIFDITEDSILSGDLEQVREYHRLAQSSYVLETRLDADDALPIDFVETVQKLKTSPLWRVHCADTHLEWQYDSPWTESQQGAIAGLSSSRCITAGLTWGYGVAANRSDIPTTRHDRIHSAIPLCNTNDSSRCLHRLGNPFMPMAFRARTPTSAGMDNVFIRGINDKSSPSISGIFKEKQDGLWRYVQEVFCVNRETVTRVRTLISSSLPAIAKDALSGQCSKGHSCKESSKEILMKIATTESVS